MPPTTSAGLLALIGIFDIVGTVASGWLTDRVDSRLLLAGYYFFRGIALLVVPSVLGPTVEPPLFFFVVFYGLDWVATVPPTVALCRQHFGLQRSGVVFGWVFASHMVGAGVAASYAGIIRESLGDYYWAWITAGAMCVVAALICLTIPRTARLDEPIADELGKETAQI
jgi:predicted MFS family arabinose efflux permease